MTALTIDVIRVFFAGVVVAAITTIAVVIITNTADVDSLADPAPRPGEDGWPRVPDEQMRIIDAALPKAQAWDQWVQYREAEKQ